MSNKVRYVLLNRSNIQKGSALIQTRFNRSCENGDYEEVKLLLADQRVDPRAQDNYAIQWAAFKGHHKVVKLLLADQRVDPTAQDNYAIKWASASGHHEVVRLLLEDGRADPTYNDNSIIRFASNNGHHEVVKLLLADLRVDPTANNNDAIRFASSRGRHEVMKLLLADSRVDLENKYARRIQHLSGLIEPHIQEAIAYRCIIINQYDLLPDKFKFKLNKLDELNSINKFVPRWTEQTLW